MERAGDCGMIRPPRDGKGCVYFVKLDDYTDCYKIGSTVNIKKRISELEWQFGKVSVVMTANTDHKYQDECEIQRLLYDYCNQKIISDAMYNRENLNPLEFPGGPCNQEHFRFDTRTLSLATAAFKSVCTDKGCSTRK
jgi:hypothetical protein